MAVITNTEKSLVANFMVNQGPLYLCIGKNTTWESVGMGSDLVPPVESATETTVIEPLVYKTVEVLKYAKLDPTNGTITYRTSKYSVTDNWQTAYAEGYNALYIMTTLTRDQLPVDISYRIVAFLINTIATPDINGVAYPADVTEPGLLFALDYRRPMTRFSDQSEIVEMVIPI
jgi:hypothetical protein